jgi:hypothetical protein
MNWCGSMKTDTVSRMVVTDKTDLNKRRVSYSMLKCWRVRVSSARWSVGLAGA